ncbi:OmpH family outer membrane protein [Bergeyella cardium]|uniref:OmpH family outer membrane protein n=1 Tax=Bergeyella cardium TaxID=1585976 RepID=UPI000EA33B52|nr:OmpH family outer membrane protein [Bergeyella cardium]
MKNLRFLLIFAFFASTLAFGQKIGVVDTNYILSKMPQYKEAEGRLNSLIQSWENELQTLQKEYDDKKAAFENEKILLVGEHLKEREKEVQELESKVKDFIKTRFGTNGEMSSMRSKFTQPFQDQIWNAIKMVVEKNNLGVVLDKSNNISVLYLDKRYDYTDKVLDVLLKRNAKPEKAKKETKTTIKKK